jgi:hypothetical protein
MSVDSSRRFTAERYGISRFNGVVLLQFNHILGLTVPLVYFPSANPGETLTSLKYFSRHYLTGQKE